MQTIEQLGPLRNAIQQLRADGPLGLVPTMGALHEGHLTLVREAVKQSAHVVVSIFVNPLQFGVNEDLDAYPRQMERDCKMLEADGVSLVWAPTVDEMYPPGFASNISVSGISDGLCGASRPGHFDGVATVVCKLFHQVLPDIAFFGEKDWQQLVVIRRMARDLDLTRPFADRIIGVPTVRESDGLAMSSRNAYLSAEERAAAASLPRSMAAAITRIKAGDEIAEAMTKLQADLVDAGFLSVDYAELRDAETLETVTRAGKRAARLLVAARIGNTRLIDNMAVFAKKS